MTSRNLVTAAAVVAALAGMTAGAIAQPPASTDNEKRIAAARAAVKGLAVGLKGRLIAAMRSGGPVAAVGVCNIQAPKIAADQSKAHGFKISRTAFKLRNQTNAPDAFEQKVMTMFAAKLKQGAKAATLEHSETVTLNGVKTFRYMKAIPMKAVPCTICHGARLPASIKAEIAKLYPQDQAIGFKPGDLRGAFSVTAAVK